MNIYIYIYSSKSQIKSCTLFLYRLFQMANHYLQELSCNWLKRQQNTWCSQLVSN